MCEEREREGERERVSERVRERVREGVVSPHWGGSGPTSWRLGRGKGGEGGMPYLLADG